MFVTIQKSDFIVENITKEIFLGKHTFTNLSYKHYKNKSMRLRIKKIEDNVQEAKAQTSVCNEEIEELKSQFKYEINSLKQKIHDLENRTTKTEKAINDINQQAVSQQFLQESLHNQSNNLLMALMRALNPESNQDIISHQVNQLQQSIHLQQQHQHKQHNKQL